MDLPRTLDGAFDLIVIADTLYYVSPLDDRMLKALAARIADLLEPGGTCLLADHFFSGADADSRRTRHIHDAFALVAAVQPDRAPPPPVLSYDRAATGPGSGRSGDGGLNPGRSIEDGPP